jgi:Zn-dependent peptidase ImmA (M78 family)
MAHEVAHYVLHRDLLREDVVDDALYRSSALSDEYERQADRFAAQILLPAEMVRDAYKSLKTLSLLAQLFDVSDAALRIRLSELGLAA